MSNRSMLEFNHDHAPFGAVETDRFLEGLRRYLSSGDPKHLPTGVTWFGMRHHSDPCPMGDPPRGWTNQAKPEPTP